MACLGARPIGEPLAEAHGVDRNGNQDMAEGRARVSAVSGAASATPPNTARERPFDARTFPIGGPERGLPSDGQGSPRIVRAVRHDARLGQVPQSVVANLILMTSLSRRSMAGVQLLLVFPSGQVTDC